MKKLISAKEAKKQGLKRYFTGKPCKHGHIDERLVSSETCCECNRLKVVQWQKDNPEKAKQKHDRWKAKNPDLPRQRAADWYQANTEQHKATMAAYFASEPHLRARLSSKARAQKLQRTPDWLTEDDVWLINEFYQLAFLRTQLTGVAWHVDHVIPLRGRNVSGLHVPANLQVIPEAANLKKGNRYAVG